jgi:hypothetical protein
MPEKETRGMSHHILAAASTLMGISFAIVTLIGAFGHADKTLVDDFALLSLFLFFAACLFSYASIRGRRRAALYEKTADGLFIVALISLTLLSLALYFGLIR